MNQPDVDAAPTRRDPLELFREGLAHFGPPRSYARREPDGEDGSVRIRFGFVRDGVERARIITFDADLDQWDNRDDIVIQRGIASGEGMQLLCRVLDAGFASIQQAREATKDDPLRRRELFRFERNKT